MDCPSRARLLLLVFLNIPGWSLKAGFFLSFPHLKRLQNVKNICTYPITTSATCSSTLGIGSIMISSSSLGLLVLETFSLFWDVEPSSLLTIAAAPGTLRLQDGVEIALSQGSYQYNIACFSFMGILTWAMWGALVRWKAAGAALLWVILELSRDAEVTLTEQPLKLQHTKILNQISVRPGWCSSYLMYFW